MATQITGANKHDPQQDTRKVSRTIQLTEGTLARLDGLAVHLGYTTLEEFLASAITSLAEKLSPTEAPFWSQPDKAYTAEVDFVVTYHGQIQADSRGEAEDLLGRVSVSDTSDESEWHVDPWEFEKSITAFYANAEDEEEGNGDGNH